MRSHRTASQNKIKKFLKKNASVINDIYTLHSILLQFEVTSTSHTNATIKSETFFFYQKHYDFWSKIVVQFALF